MNKVIETGYIASDIELKNTNNGISVTSFDLAVRRPHARDKTDFFRVVCWRNTAEFVSKYFSKGSGIEVTGHLETRTWEDQNGAKRYTVEIIAEEVDFGKNSKSDGSNDAGTNAPGYNPYEVPQFEEIKQDDDLPF